MGCKNGETCTYDCKDNHSKESGTKTTVCVDGSCRGLGPRCGDDIIGGCDYPYEEGETCTLQCLFSEPKSGNTKTTCINGKWTGPPLVCKEKGLVRVLLTLVLIAAMVLQSEARGLSKRAQPRSGCDRPPNTVGSRREGCRYPYENGENCTYKSLAGDSSITCQDGFWSGPPLICIYAGCKRLRFTGSRSEGCRWPHENGETCTFTCREGHSRVSGNSTRTGAPLVCTWSSASTGCEPPSYRRYGARPPRGCHRPYEEGETCKFGCRFGFEQQSGDTTTTCKGGKWTGQLLVCTRIPGNNYSFI
ncbi:coagulation factor XIII B chain-like [Branchiostoma lanceolatum]|uniref:coagulation factor XIII B chain-like n=1 Tax=Branchiostoma lanceolatum TaxID=7740 RepID=UPI00345474D1